MKNPCFSLRALLFAALAALFCFSAYMLASDLLAARREAEVFSSLARQVERAKGGRELEGSDRPGLPEGAEEQEDIYDVYARLAEENPDMFGWVQVEGTRLNYPVMHTPREPEYYLRRGFDRRYALSGTPFLDAECGPDCGNYLLYGHNMKDGAMFHDLLSYAQEEFWREHPVIRFDTVQEQGTYRVLSAFYSQVYPVTASGVFRYYQYADLRDEADFSAYLEGVTRAALYDTGVTAQYGDQLLTLSTCSYHVKNGRFVVVARRDDPPPAA